MRVLHGPRRSYWRISKMRAGENGSFARSSRPPRRSSSSLKPGRISYRESRFLGTSRVLIAKKPATAVFCANTCKVATGTGKTTVMAMLTAWSILNKVASRGDNASRMSWWRSARTSRFGIV
jgi:hypothetical protein